MISNEIPELDDKGLRSFGLTTGAIVGILFGLFFPWLLGLAIPVWPWLLALVLPVWGITHPRSLGPVYRVWMKFGLLLSRVTTPIILGLIFFVVIMPMGLIMRLFNDPMRRSFRTTEASYRVVNDDFEQSMERPF